MTPPRLAERVMRWSLSPEDRPAVLGDLQEEFESIVAGGSKSAARRWYWRQALTSAIPNIARQTRQAYLRECGGDKARAAQAKARRLALLILGLSGALVLVLFALTRDVTQTAYAMAAGFGLALLMLFSSYFETGRPRAPKPGESLLRIGIVAAWFWALVANRQYNYLLVIVGLSNLLNHWPRFLWPVPARRQPPSYSVRTPVVTFRQADGSMYSTSTVPTEAMAMDRPTLGRATPATIPAEDIVEGVVPLSPVLTRSFPATESIRVFSVLNANPDVVTATLEVRRQPEDAVVRRVPVTVRLATPKLPPSVVATLDEADRPNLSKSPMSELDVVVPLAGLAPGRYRLRLIATEGTVTSSQDEEIVVLPLAAR